MGSSVGEALLSDLWHLRARPLNPEECSAPNSTASGGCWLSCSKVCSSHCRWKSSSGSSSKFAGFLFTTRSETAVAALGGGAEAEACDVSVRAL